MALFPLNNVSIRGIASCVPKGITKIDDYPLFSPEEKLKFSQLTGVIQKRKADDQTTSSDLCYHAAETLISRLGWEKESIDALIFVSQTPDYILPATSCILQNRLGLSIDTYTLDINSGCSGWVYGLSTMSQFLSHGGMKRGLLLAGETNFKLTSEFDNSSYLLYGDAGSATALEFDTDAKTSFFHLQTDGEGHEMVIIPDGGFRNPTSEKSFIYEENDRGIKINRLQIRLNGFDAFTFELVRGPQTVNKILEYTSIQRENVDYFLFSQASMFVNEKIRKKLKLMEDHVPLSLKYFGNTSSASIPLTMTTQIREQLQHQSAKLVFCGLGVGLSWGSAYFETNHLICPELIEI